MTTYFIHLEDPQFAEGPWPGIRRLGPFNTQEEALNQAASDAAYGGGTALGVFTDEESDSNQVNPENATPVHTSADIQQEADTIIQNIQEATLAILDQAKADYEATITTPGTP